MRKLRPGEVRAFIQGHTGWFVCVNLSWLYMGRKFCMTIHNIHLNQHRCLYTRQWIMWIQHPHTYGMILYSAQSSVLKGKCVNTQIMWLKQQTFILSQLWKLKSKSSVGMLASLLGFQVTSFLLCLHMAFPLCVGAYILISSPDEHNSCTGLGLTLTASF
jgi:hypothetical protein